MTPRIKLVLGFLSAVAVLSLVSFFGTFSSVSFRANLPGLGQAAILPSDNTDTDGDGLSDALESYWNTDFQDPDTDKDGFKDGEEVLSSHDPTVPGPDDKIIPNDAPQNITQKIGGLVLGGLYEGSLQKDSPKFDESVNLVVNDAVNQYGINAGTVTASQIIVTDDSANNNSTYANAMKSFLQSGGQDILQSMPRLSAAAGTATESDTSKYETFFTAEDARLAEHIATLEKIVVPKAWVSVHQEVILSIKAIRRSYKLIRESEAGSDPIQGAIAASSLSDFIYVRFLAALQKYEPLFSIKS